MNKARITFLSGAPTSNIVGATASTLLECDEAQDVEIEKWDQEINPMAASTNATKVFWGTAWTGQTLLAREKRSALEAQRRDGRRRVFHLTADEVAREVPTYGQFVEAEVRKLGRNHPFVRTQYFSEEVEAVGGMFTPEHIALMRGAHPALTSPRVGQVYCFLIDVGGRGGGDPTGADPSNEPDHDATALTIVEVDLGGLADEILQAPIYRVVWRQAWMGTAHPTLYGVFKGLGDLWQPRWVVIDAKGLGAGLAAFLEKVFPRRVIPFVFTQASKSRLGWGFLTLIETRRFLDYALVGAGGNPADFQNANRSSEKLSSEFYRQLAACQMEALPGPERRLRWGVPDGQRDPLTGARLHDDLVISAALCALPDEQAWGRAESGWVRATDILAGMKEVY